MKLLFPRVTRLASVFAAAAFLTAAPVGVLAQEPFFKKGDVIALVGGEDMVAMSG